MRYLPLYSKGCQESQGSSCSIQLIASDTAPDNGWLYSHCVFIGHIARHHWLWLSGSNVTSCVQYNNVCNLQLLQFGSLKPPKHRLSPRWRASPYNFVVKLNMLTIETLSCFAVKTVWSYLQLFCHNTFALQMTDDRRQTTSYDKSGTLRCKGNVPLKTCIYGRWCRSKQGDMPAACYGSMSHREKLH